MKLNQLWNWNGAVGRREYLLWGMLLFALKWNLDRFVFGWLPGGRLINLTD